MNGKSINVLCIANYFLPGYKGGGPVTTISNMRKQLVGEINISVFTRDRDLGSNTKYQGVDLNLWLETKEGPIYYATPDSFGLRGLKHATKNKDFDVVYLNSFFSPKASILPYLFIKRLLPKSKILIAPRGEFSPGAINIKRLKKQIFIKLVRSLYLYRDVYWHASTKIESDDILRIFPNARNRIMIAADPIQLDLTALDLPREIKEFGSLKMVFISRISPMKNILGLILVLKEVEAQVQLDIYGPIEDQNYWNLCVANIKTLPNNIKIILRGPIAPDLVLSTFAKYNIFALPTFGENFGHVIFEALSAGVPVLLSDQTPWKADTSNALTIIPLNDIHGWKAAIEDAANRTDEEQTRIAFAAQTYAKRYVADEGSYKDNSAMFTKVLNS